MLDSHGNLITISYKLQKHTLEHYTSVFSNRTIKEDLEQVKYDIEELFKAATRSSQIK